MGYVTDPNRLMRDNNMKGGAREGLIFSIPNCHNQPTNQCSICSNHFCYEHTKSHIHPNEFPNIQKEK